MPPLRFRSIDDIMHVGLAAFVVLLGLFSAFFFYGSPPEGETAPAAGEKAQIGSEDAWTVTHVADGDTFTVTRGFETATVRLIGVDTPEKGECYSTDAASRLKQLLLEEPVDLRIDDSQGDKDHYGRLLRYAYLTDGTNVNLSLVEDGYAREYTFEKAYEQQDAFRAAEQEARAEGTGLWGASTCAGLTDGLGSGVSDPDCLIKGNINSVGGKLYHLPGCRDYDRTTIDTNAGEMWFCSEEEAVANGWNRARSCSP